MCSRDSDRYTSPGISVSPGLMFFFNGLGTVSVSSLPQSAVARISHRLKFRISHSSTTAQQPSSTPNRQPRKPLASPQQCRPSHASFPSQPLRNIDLTTVSPCNKHHQSQVQSRGCRGTRRERRWGRAHSRLPKVEVGHADLLDGLNATPLNRQPGEVTRSDTFIIRSVPYSRRRPCIRCVS